MEHGAFRCSLSTVTLRIDSLIEQAATENSQDAKLENSVTLFAPTQVTAKNLRMMKELLERQSSISLLGNCAPY